MGLESNALATLFTLARMLRVSDPLIMSELPAWHPQLLVTHRAAAKKSYEFSLSQAAAYVCCARIHDSERREGSMPLFIQEASLKDI